MTEVLSRGAGLYLIDGRVALCLANQPLPARPIRPGDRLEVSLDGSEQVSVGLEQVLLGFAVV